MSDHDDRSDQDREARFPNCMSTLSRREWRERRRETERRRRENEAAIVETILMPVDYIPAGYPLQAAFQSSDSSFSVYRRFDYLQGRVILDLQDELRRLEEELIEMDEDDFYSNDPQRKQRVRSRDADLEQDSKGFFLSGRPSLLANIRLKLSQYHETLIKAQELAEFQRPSERDYANVRLWVLNNKPLSYEPEQDFIKRKGDLITLRPRAEWGKLDGWVEGKIRTLPTVLKKYFVRAEYRDITVDENLHYYSPSRIEKFTTLIIASAVIALLAIPVFVMFKVSLAGGRNTTFLNVGILIIFTLLFSGSMSLLTKAKRAELFAASAAYCAVLIVFIGNFSGEGSGLV